MSYPVHNSTYAINTTRMRARPTVKATSIKQSVRIVFWGHPTILSFESVCFHDFVQWLNPKTKTIPPEWEELFVQKGVLSSLLRLFLFLFCCHIINMLVSAKIDPHLRNLHAKMRLLIHYCTEVL